MIFERMSFNYYNNYSECSGYSTTQLAKDDIKVT